ncbi:uncharacterized protein LOC114519836 [Dendronephthya gigantea]|uniref:uncharacterized protein LOC114519836 n=1 Tax=Dendronephthya gigantea TaxID=151771 RepID=UPI00106B0423|nr:uncharacterized protein LOC114519836 [Dendronephthya gigantea]XP_028395815.1 uncharacterized protein LOC114519836 [Dendronephthya gigantea]
MTDEKSNIRVKDFDKLKTLVGQLIKLHKDVENIVNTRVPLGETEDKKANAITTHIVSQEEFFKEVNEVVFQKRRLLKELNTLVLRLCRSVEVLEDGQNSATNGEGASAAANHEQNSKKDEKPRSSQTVSSIPLRTLLQCIVTRMTTLNWEELRRYVGRQIPARVLRNVPNDIEFFQELENREMIRVGNTEYIRNGLYDIGRVDLVHLLDCIQEGDYSLLQPDVTSQISEQTRREGASGNAESRSITREMPNLTVDGESGTTADQNVLWPSEANGTSTSSQDTTLQRRYRNVPQRTATPPAYPVQEDTESISSTGAHQPAPEAGVSGSEEGTQVQTSANQSNEGITSTQTTDTSNASNQGTGSEDSTPQSVIPQERDVQSTPEENTRSVNEEDIRAWMQNRDYSCDHYDRYCTVQFACCDRFWPCHRCHNSQSQCAERKLRSRDIKKVKCRRCGKIQDFPKESPNCVQCNLKFAEYFCPICQHLTGTQNHPFHCNKCGICRVHGDRSFHCDVCGVCLDVNLRGNHRCREGSAHDECCICFEDAFTGCQILPCSHKVHKECASQMVRSGITQCPICRQSFGKIKTDKSKK